MLTFEGAQVQGSDAIVEKLKVRDDSKLFLVYREPRLLTLTFYSPSLTFTFRIFLLNGSNTRSRQGMLSQLAPMVQVSASW
jgi:hypothetical protein